MYHTYKQQIQYVFFGVLTTLINILIYYFSIYVFSLSNVQSSIWAWIGSVVFAYVTNRTWVFESNAVTFLARVRECSQFVVSRLVTGWIDILIMWIGVDVMRLDNMIIKVLANGIVILLNYIVSKNMVFK